MIGKLGLYRWDSLTLRSSFSPPQPPLLSGPLNSGFFFKPGFSFFPQTHRLIQLSTAFHFSTGNVPDPFSTGSSPLCGPSGIDVLLDRYVPTDNPNLEVLRLSLKISFFFFSASYKNIFFLAFKSTDGHRPGSFPPLEDEGKAIFSVKKTALFCNVCGDLFFFNGFFFLFKKELRMSHLFLLVPKSLF